MKGEGEPYYLNDALGLSVLRLDKTVSNDLPFLLSVGWDIDPIRILLNLPLKKSSLKGLSLIQKSGNGIRGRRPSFPRASTTRKGNADSGSSAQAKQFSYPKAHLVSPSGRPFPVSFAVFYVSYGLEGFVVTDLEPFPYGLVVEGTIVLPIVLSFYIFEGVQSYPGQSPFS